MGRRTSQEWQAIIEQQQASGQSVVDFCQQQQLDSKYFYARRRALLKRQQRQLPTPFVKLSKSAPNTAMLLQFGDTTLSLPANTKPDWVAQLLKGLSV